MVVYNGKNTCTQRCVVNAGSNFACAKPTAQERLVADGMMNEALEPCHVTYLNLIDPTKQIESIVSYPTKI